ncbi:MAG: hypothetical protein GWN71_20810, partial [Gammaproteobacteria bacterium]|nr:hypothetical protein [Gemmatimonadota bacterium]NIU75916.1 hypothetical protein [Gammaproteobacteria bacterium]
YGTWAYTPFNPISPAILLDILQDLKFAGSLMPQLSGDCLIPGTCAEPTAGTPTPTASGTPGPATATPSQTLTPSNTVPPTATFTPSNTPTPEPTDTPTQTPTPLVHPAKVSNPEEVLPGTTVNIHFVIVVVNGSDETASLTRVVDTLPSGMTYRDGCAPAGCTISGGGSTITWDGLSVDIPAGFS